MNLFINAETNVPDVRIDYIDIILKNGKTVNTDWDESDYIRSPKGFAALLKNIHLNECGELQSVSTRELHGFKVAALQTYSPLWDYEDPTGSNITITEAEFQDRDQLIYIPMAGDPK